MEWADDIGSRPAAWSCVPVQSSSCSLLVFHRTLAVRKDTHLTPRIIFDEPPLPPRTDPSLGPGYRSHAQELALLLAQEMLGRLAKHVASVLPHSINSIAAKEASSAAPQPPLPEQGGRVGVNPSVSTGFVEANSDAFDILPLTWLLDEVEESRGEDCVLQKQRLLLPAAAHCVPALKVTILHQFASLMQ